MKLYQSHQVNLVFPAKAGIQFLKTRVWTPASAGETVGGPRWVDETIKIDFVGSVFLSRCIVLFCFLFLGIFSRVDGALAAPPPWASEVLQLVQNGGVYAEGKNGEVLFSHRATVSFMPASTLKVVTALTALNTLGSDYRFKTEFYYDADATLYVKGYGDPYLVSEELKLIAQNMKNKGLKSVKKIVLDPTYFEEIKVPGVSASTNPYDALNSALSANFNTIVIEKTKSGVTSGEAQTPMTELTRTFAARAPYGKSRINLADHPEESMLYVGYLLKAFLEQEGVQVSGPIVKGVLNKNAKLAYKHLSSKKLDEVLQAMLKFSTNFIANQLFLVMGAETYGAPANLEKGRKVVTQFLKAKVGLENVKIDEGSGISRANQISPAELAKVLSSFEKFEHLLPEKMEGITAKTGTLNGVSCLAGYFPSSKYGLVRFVILLNQTQGNRERIAKVLYEHLH